MGMINRIKMVIFSLVLSLLVSTANAGLIVGVDIEELAGDFYLYNYTITNPTLTPFGFSYFDVYFDYALFDDIEIDGSPSADWDGLAFDPDASFLLDGLADWLYLPGSFSLDAVPLADFAVLAHYVGSASFDPLSSQSVEFYSDGFHFLGGEQTTLTSFTQLVNVPEPHSLALFMIALVGFYTNKRMR